MSKMHVQASIQDDAARLGFIKKRLPPDYRNVVWLIRCSKCPREFQANWNPGTAPDLMKRNAHTRGWDVDYGMRPLCPDCAHSKNKGPVAKPEHQSFERWMPPQTLIFDKLLDASNKRSARAQLPALYDEIAALDAEAAKAQAAKKAAQAELTEAEKLAAKQARMRHAQAMRALRLREEKERRERAALQAPAPALVTTPVVPAPQAVIAPQAEEVVMNMSAQQPTPTPKITHSVFQCLDGVFDANKRLYKNGFSDARVAKECGTSEQVVAYLRTETFGELAEDPRYSALRDDIDLLAMESAEMFAKLQKQLGDVRSRLEQLAHHKS